MTRLPIVFGSVLGLGLLLGAPGGALAKPAYVATTVNLRASAGTDSEVVAKIPGGSLVDADNCTDGWCAVTWQEKTGFAIQRALDLSGRVPPRRVVRGGPVYIDEPPVYYPPPPIYVRPYYGRYYYGRPWRHHHW